MNSKKDKFIPRVILMLAALALVIALIVKFRSGSVGEVVVTESAGIEENGIESVPQESEASYPQNEAIKEETALQDEDDTVYLEDDPIDAWHEMQELLRESTDANDLIVAALFSRSSGALGRLDLNRADALLLKAFELEPDNILVNLQIKQFCDENPSFSVCGLNYLHNLQSLAPENASVLMRLANSYYDFSNFQQSLALLQKAGQTDFDDYYVDYMNVLDNVFNKYGNRNGNRTILDLIFYRNFATQLSANRYQYIRICQERVVAQADGWQQACRDSGKKLAENGHNRHESMMGYRMFYQFSDFPQEEIDFLLSKKEDEAIAQLDQDNETVIPFLTSESDRDIPNGVWEEFLQIYRRQGERQALHFLYESLSKT